MFDAILVVLRSIRAAFQRRDELVLENLALRHQLTVLRRHADRPRFRRSDRLLWVFLRAVWSRWEMTLVIIQPQTVSIIVFNEQQLERVLREYLDYYHRPK